MKTLLFVGCLCVPTLVFAEDNQQPARLAEIEVSSTPLGLSPLESAQTVSTLDGDKLELSAQGTLGETLANEPGVSTTSFGAGSSRPVIRGLGGDRIRVLQNGLSSLDVSNTSPDHAVSIEPLLLKKVDVVRGPATLLYGTSAVGGVVNSIDNRISEELPGGPASGALEIRGGTVDDERAAVGQIDAPIGNLALHFDGSTRETHDYRIPGGRLPYSDTESDSLGFGGTYIFQDGFAGVAGSTYDTTYGVPNGEENVSIELNQRRLETRSHFENVSPSIQSADFKFAYADYEHTEFEGEEVGTIFQNTGVDGRLEIAHAPHSGFEGVGGLQLQTNDFEAIGEEAFLPPTKTDVLSAFLFEHAPISDALEFQAGLRIDGTRLTPDAAQAREFATLGLSSGLVWNTTTDSAVSLSVAYTERAPSAQELYANGLHVATASFEIGEPTLSRERSVGVDLSFRRTGGIVTGSFTPFFNRYFDFIGLRPTADFFETEEGDSFRKYRFEQQEVQFFGFETQCAFHILGPVEADVPPAEDLALVIQPDWVWAEDINTGESVPRLPPFRLLTAIDYSREDLKLRLELKHAFRQDRNANDETETSGYTLLNFYSAIETKFIDGSSTQWFVRGTNLLNEEIQNSVSFIKDVAPLQGANISTGIRVTF